MHCSPLASLGHTLENPFDGAAWQLASLTLAVHYLARRLEQLSLSLLEMSAIESGRVSDKNRVPRPLM